MKFKIILTLILISIIITGCATTGNITKEKNVKIGAILSLTGPAAAWGESARQGIELAVDEINSNGGINGRKLLVIYENDGTESKNTVTAFNKLVKVDDVDAIIGGTWDFNYNVIAPLAESYKITLITPQNLKTEGLVINDYTFIMRPELRKITYVLKDEIERENINNIAIVRYLSSFGQALSDGLNDIMKEKNNKLVLDETYESLGGNDFMTLVTKIKNSKADAVFLDMLDSDIINFIKRAREQNLEIIIFSHSIVEDAFSNPDISSTDKSLLDGIIYFDWDTPPSEEFRKIFREKYNEEPSRSTDGAYDSVMIIAKGLSETNKDNLHNYIKSHSFQTLNGEITFKDNVVNTRIVYIKKIINGKPVTLNKIEVKT